MNVYLPAGQPQQMTGYPAELFGHGSGRRWMLFVDGENFTFRGQEYARQQGIDLHLSRYYMKDVYLWLPDWRAGNSMVPNAPHLLQPTAVRAFYYTSIVGDDNKLNAVRQSLWEIGFQAQVFKKDKQKTKSKGVDIALAKDFLSNAFLDNYDVAVLIAGDADYLPIIDEVKRLGKLVYVIFFHGAGSGLSINLHLSSDEFFCYQWFVPGAMEGIPREREMIMDLRAGS